MNSHHDLDIQYPFTVCIFSWLLCMGHKVMMDWRKKMRLYEPPYLRRYIRWIDHRGRYNENYTIFWIGCSDQCRIISISNTHVGGEVGNAASYCCVLMNDVRQGNGLSVRLTIELDRFEWLLIVDRKLFSQFLMTLINTCINIVRIKRVNFVFTVIKNSYPAIFLTIV